jgi:hypothetical protein
MVGVLNSTYLDESGEKGKLLGLIDLVPKIYSCFCFCFYFSWLSFEEMAIKYWALCFWPQYYWQQISYIRGVPQSDGHTPN